MARPHSLITPRTLLIGVCLLAIVAAVGYFQARGGDAEMVEFGAAGTREVFQSFVTASGEIIATRFADIGSSVMGRVVELSVREGDRVSAGQILARMARTSRGRRC